MGVILAFALMMKRHGTIFLNLPLYKIHHLKTWSNTKHLISLSDSFIRYSEQIQNGFVTFIFVKNVLTSHSIKHTIH